MFTQCPHCEAIFQVSASHLKAAAGDVRCGQCLTVFNALDHLSEELPTPSQASGAEDLAQDANQYSHWVTESAAPADIETAHADATADLDEALAHAPTEEVTAEDVAELEIKPSAEEETNNGDELADETVDETSDETLDEATAEISASAEPTTDIFTEVLVEASTHAIPEDEINRFEEFLADDALQASAVTDPDVATEIVEENHTELGDVETATADLDIESLMADDEEFAEFDEYLTNADDETREQVAEFDPRTFSADTAAPLPDHSAGDDEAIIIEEADLEPVASAAYADTVPAADTEPTVSDVQQSPLDNAEEIAAETPATSADDAGDTAQTLKVPSLILEDLHAAKAEQLRPSNTPWVVGSLVLMLTLVLQVIYFSRDELARDPSMRPWLVQMCQWTGCTLTQPYDIQQIEIIGRDVRSHPTARKALIASTSLINNAPFVQPFPLLTVVFSDINGKQLARRRFTPREYLNNSVDLAAGMTPDTPVRIELELVDPGKAAVNYEFHAELDPRATRPLT